MASEQRESVEWMKMTGDMSISLFLRRPILNDFFVA